LHALSEARSQPFWSQNGEGVLVQAAIRPGKVRRPAEGLASSPAISVVQSQETAAQSIGSLQSVDQLDIIGCTNGR
jgi:hypothetical protein